MATYVIGDIHGCFVEFLMLLEKMRFNPDKDHLILTGDLLGRGPYSLETLNYIMHLSLVDKCADAVLGNHDLNFLAIYYKVRENTPSNKLESLLQSSNVDKIVTFLSSLPLLYLDTKLKFAVCHAGIYPHWGLKRAKLYSDEIQTLLNDPIKRILLLRNMYADNPVNDSDLKCDLSRWRFIINSFTRMRLCDKNNNLDFKHKTLNAQDAKKLSIFPWFNYGHPSRFDEEQYELYFGHWAALRGACFRPNIHALDLGCIWGDKLCGICVQSGEVFTVKSRQTSTAKK